jgi:hypothetical protein
MSETTTTPTAEEVLRRLRQGLAEFTASLKSKETSLVTDLSDVIERIYTMVKATEVIPLDWAERLAALKRKWPIESEEGDNRHQYVIVIWCPRANTFCLTYVGLEDDIPQALIDINAHDECLIEWIPVEIMDLSTGRYYTCRTTAWATEEVDFTPIEGFYDSSRTAFSSRALKEARKELKPNLERDILS